MDVRSEELSSRAEISVAMASNETEQDRDRGRAKSIAGRGIEYLGLEEYWGTCVKCVS